MRTVEERARLFRLVFFYFVFLCVRARTKIDLWIEIEFFSEEGRKVCSDEKSFPLRLWHAHAGFRLVEVNAEQRKRTKVRTVFENSSRFARNETLQASLQKPHHDRTPGGKTFVFCDSFGKPDPALRTFSTLIRNSSTFFIISSS